MDVAKKCISYCIGCGLCQSEFGTETIINKKGYERPKEFDDEFVSNVCPIFDDEKNYESESDLWGTRKAVYSGFSKDGMVREKASSGGLLTQLAIYLLESRKVDGIIQIRAEKGNPTRTEICVSTTRENIIECCGSRYSISNPLKTLSTIAEEDKNYALIAKPCDIKAVRRLQKYNGQYMNIKYLMSFFCAGLPSVDAQKELLRQLSCDEGKVCSLTYRGNGWPGYTTAIDDAGKEHTMKYAQAWGGILGRDVHPFCRLCMDGIGEAADIACGDGWYLKEDGTPDFSEHEGRNVVFARTDIGQELLQEANAAGTIELESWNDIAELQLIQKYQFDRKATMSAKLCGYKIMGRSTPDYDKKLLKRYAKQATGKEKFRIFVGTIKRILQKKI